MIGTAILSGMIFLITDEHRKIPKRVQPFLAGLAMTMIAMSFGANCGFAINPARDLGPRLFLLIIQGWTAFSYASQAFIVTSGKMHNIVVRVWAISVSTYLGISTCKPMDQFGRPLNDVIPPNYSLFMLKTHLI